jgi:hypothetical protein
VSGGVSLFLLEHATIAIAIAIPVAAHRACIGQRNAASIEGRVGERPSVASR